MCRTNVLKFENLKSVGTLSLFMLTVTVYYCFGGSLSFSEFVIIIMYDFNLTGTFKKMYVARDCLMKIIRAVLKIKVTRPESVCHSSGE